MSVQNSIAVGDIRFLDNCVPSITAGEYKIDVTHTITEVSHGINTLFESKQKFQVLAPRFSLPAGTVSSRYPDPSSESDFHESLPFIVLNDEHLPWSRALNVSPNAQVPSWIALMIFQDNELKPSYQVPASGLSNPTYSTVNVITTGANGDIVLGTAGTNVVFPPIALSDYEQTIANLSASTVDVPMAIFQALAPQLSELPYLAHLRQVNTGGQSIDGITGNGSYSIVLSNRLPTSVLKSNPSAKPGPVKYIVHLVSMEGWENYLPKAANPAPVQPGQVARLISLDSWSFTNDPDGPDFAQLVTNLDKGALSLKFTQPANWGTPTPQQTEVKTRTNNGYVALNYTTRLGEKSFAWYRGPFTPVVPPMLQNTLPGFNANGGTPFTNPDDAIIYDAVNGVFDQSYAVAFETGKMVTLANRSASLAIWQWKKDGIRLLQILNKLLAQYNPQTLTSNLALRQPMAAPMVSSAAPVVGAPIPAFLANNQPSPVALTSTPDWSGIKNKLVDLQTGHQNFVQHLATSLAPNFVNGEGHPSVQMADLSKLNSHNDPDNTTKHMPGLLTPNELKQAAATAADPHVMVIKKLLQSQS